MLDNNVLLKLIEEIKHAPEACLGCGVAFFSIAFPEGGSGYVAVIEHSKFDFGVSPERPIPIEESCQ